MSDMLMQYGLFLAQAVTVVVAIGAIAAIVAGAARRGTSDERLEIRHINARLDDARRALRREILPRRRFRAEERQRRAARKRAARSERRRVFVIEFHGDIRASGVGSLREEVSSVLGAATSDDEVVVKLESSGGLVHEHGLAASQLLRLREHGIPLTVVVDKIAASGGYMMACTADRIVAAPFAILGSIGVLLQLPNFNRLLDAHGIDFEQIKGGEHKRSLTLFGKNTEADRVHMREEINHTHELFKRFVAEHRPGLDLAVAATGEHWYGRRALEFGLCDTLGTSDDYLIGACESADVYLVRRRAKRTLAQRLAAAAQATFTGLGLRAWQLEHERRLSGG